VHLCECVRVRVRVLASGCWCVHRYRVIDIFKGIDCALMEKSLVMLKVMYKTDLPRRCAPAHNMPPFRNIYGGPASTSHHVALNGCTIFRCPRSLMHAPQCPLSSDV
jgi:hypothetical protein